MGLIREPKGIDLIVGPSILTEQEKQTISRIIAVYKQTGKIPSKTYKKASRRRKIALHRKSTVNSEPFGKAFRKS